MAATTNLTWTKQTAEHRTCSDPRFSMAMSQGRRFTLHYNGVAVCKGTKAACEAFANDIAAGRLAAYPQQQADAAAAEAGIDEAVTVQQQPAAEAEQFDYDHIHTTPDGRHFRHGDGREVDGDGNEISLPAAGLYPAGYDENIIVPDHEFMPAAESRTKPGRTPVKLTSTLEIAGQTYVRRNYAPEHGHEVVGLSGPKGVEYRCLLHGAESVCSCPAFEHRGGWCKHLDALVGPRNTVKGVGVEPEPKPEVMPSAASRTKKTPDQLNAEAKKRGKQPRPAADEPDAVRDDEPKKVILIDASPVEGFSFTGVASGRTQAAVPNVAALPRAAGTVRLETLPPGTEFHLSGKNGKLVDVNEGFATVRLEGEHTNQQWSPAAEVKLGRFLDNRKRSEIRIMVEGEVSDPQNSGEVKMKVTSTALALLFSELGASPSKVAKWSAADFGSRIKQLPDKAKGKVVADTKAAKLLKDILAALEEGEDIAVEMAAAPEVKAEANGKAAKKAAKAEANGHTGKNGKAAKVKPGKDKEGGKPGRPKIMGKYGVGPFVRWLGRQGINFDGAKMILTKEQKGAVTLSDPSIKWELKERREGKEAADVSKEDAKTIKEKYAKAFA